jgi:hypothetical protein
MYISEDELIGDIWCSWCAAFCSAIARSTLPPLPLHRNLTFGAVQAQEFLRGFEAEGFIEPTEGSLPDSETTYETTIEGNALATASAAKPIRRATAEFALRQFHDPARPAQC